MPTSCSMRSAICWRARWTRAVARCGAAPAISLRRSRTRARRRHRHRRHRQRPQRRKRRRRSPGTAASRRTALRSRRARPRPSAMSGDRPVLLLPGRIDAAIAGWLTMGLPLIDRLAGSSDGSDPSTAAKLTRKVASPIGLVEIVPVRLMKARRRAHSLGLLAAGTARQHRWLDSGARQQRRFSGRKRGRGKTLAMSDRLDKSAASHDLIETDPPRRAAGAIPRSRVRRGSARAICAPCSILRRCRRSASRSPHALGRVLAHDVKAPIDVPPFDRSNVDGFALRAADTVGATDTAPQAASAQRARSSSAATRRRSASSPAPPPPSPPAAWCRAAPTPS